MPTLRRSVGAPGIRRALPAVGLLALALAVPASGAELRGRLRLLQDGRPAAAADFAGAVVWFTPQGGAPPKAPAEPATMATRRKQFEPRVLVVPVGGRVRFPNRDPILHNVFSVSGGNGFDVGLYGTGEGQEVTFGEAGLVRVFCNVHHSMIGYVVVVDTAHHAVPGRDGSFVLAGVPAGPGTLTVWHERAEPLRREIVVPASGEVRVDLEISRPRVPQHLNKFGKPYRREGRRAYR